MIVKIIFLKNKKGKKDTAETKNMGTSAFLTVFSRRFKPLLLIIPSI